MKIFKENALDKLDAIERNIDDLYSEIDDVRDLIKINEEIEEFLYYLANNDKLPKYITNKADDLWRQV